jgi:hypothetical protein
MVICVVVEASHGFLESRVASTHTYVPVFDGVVLIRSE